MKLPNGFGSVYKMSGNRRRPWAARLTTGWDYDENTGRAKQKTKIIGYFQTRKEALDALVLYHQNPYDLDKDIQLKDLYERWSNVYFQRIAQTGIRTVKSAWNYCFPLYNMKVRDLRIRHIKQCIHEAYVIKIVNGEKVKVMASPSQKARIKSIFNLMLDYAVEYEVVEQNYARAFQLDDKIAYEKEENRQEHISFTVGEQELLWNSVNEIAFVDMILVGIYSGWRPQELALLTLDNVDLRKGIMTGGMKTKAGKDRIVPIHSKIRTLIEKRYRQATELGSVRLFNDITCRSGMELDYNKYSYRFCKVMDRLPMERQHRPHDTRKTFITRAKAAGVDEYAIKRIVGHTITDITEHVYTERTIEWLKYEIEKIKD